MSLGLGLALTRGKGGGATPPVNTVRPGALTGTLQIGQTLTSPDTGTWTGTPTINYTRQWYRADPTYSAETIVTSGGDVVYTGAAAIAGETGASYVLAAADANKVIFCRVTATNGAGSVTADTLCTTAVVLDPSAATALAAITVKTDFRQTLYNTLIIGLKAAGSYWTSMDVIRTWAAANAQAAAVNLKNPGTYTGSPQSSPTFTTDRGYLTNGTSSYLDEGFDPSLGGSNYSLNSCHIAIWSRTSAQTGGTHLGWSDGTQAIRITPRDSSDRSLGRANENTSSGSAVSSVLDGTGMFATTRSTSTALRLSKNGVNLSTHTQSTIGLPVGTIKTGRGAAASFQSCTTAMTCIGANVSQADEALAYAAFLAFFTAIGAAP